MYCLNQKLFTLILNIGFLCIKAGYQVHNINLNALRLCFQVFLENMDDPNRPFNVALNPVVSKPIFDKKVNTDLVITKLSHVSCSVLGGTEIILLCEKVRV